MGCPANLLVHCLSGALRAQAAQIVFASGGYRLVHFGRWVVDAIEPEGVPDEAPKPPWEREYAPAVVSAGLQRTFSRSAPIFRWRRYV